MAIKWKKNPKLDSIKSFNDKDKVICTLRNINKPREFLYPRSSFMHQGLKLKNMREAVNRYKKAIEENEMIVISGDPDCDGVTSLVEAYQYTREYTDNVGYSYAQKLDGHGIEKQIEFLENNFKSIDLLIIVDSSSSSIEGVAKVKELFGCDVIILDHHELETREVPDAILVNPQQAGDNYPNKDLSGAGVVFKFIEQAEKVLDGGVDVFKYLDLVAVGMIGDIMKVNDPENRYLMLTGMKNIQNVGLKRILKGAQIDEDEVSSSDVGFTIAPMINGAVRLGQVELAIQLLLSKEDRGEAMPLRLKLHKMNEKRKEQQREYASQIIDDLSKNEIRSTNDFSKPSISDKILILCYDLPPEYNGLVAGQLAEHYSRPVLILNSPREENSIVYGGSARSYNEFDLKQFFADTKFFKQVIGHAGSFGAYINEGNIPLLREHIHTYFEENGLGVLGEVDKYYDLELDADEVADWIPTINKYNRLSGRGFERIIVKVKDVMIDERKILGKNNDTVKISTMGDLNLMKFRTKTTYGDELESMSIINAYGELNMNKFFWRGKGWVHTPQVFLQDYEVVV